MIEHENHEERKRLFQDEFKDFIDDEDYEEEDDDDDEDDELEEDDDEEMEDGPSTSTAKPKRPSKPKKKKGPTGNRRKKGRKSSKSPEIDGRETPPPEIQEWARALVSEGKLVSEADQDAFQLSNKLMLLAEIIKKCEEIGDKL